MTNESETKKCPYCGEMININAKKCKFCSEWLEGQTSEKPKIINCPYCGEEILSVAKKCKHCGEYLCENSNQCITLDSDNYILNKIAKMQKVSNMLWKVVSILMLIAGFLHFAYGGETWFQNDAEMNEWLCYVQGAALLILGVYNLIHIPSELPNKILKSDYYVVKCYENITSFIIALIINFFISIIGGLLAGFDLYIRKVVMDNAVLFKNNKN